MKIQWSKEHLSNDLWALFNHMTSPVTHQIRMIRCYISDSLVVSRDSSEISGLTLTNKSAVESRLEQWFSSSFTTTAIRNWPDYQRLSARDIIIWICHGLNMGIVIKQDIKPDPFQLVCPFERSYTYFTHDKRPIMTPRNYGTIKNSSKTG